MLVYIVFDLHENFFIVTLFESSLSRDEFVRIALFCPLSYRLSFFPIDYTEVHKLSFVHGRSAPLLQLRQKEHLCSIGL